MYHIFVWRTEVANNFIAYRHQNMQSHIADDANGVNLGDIVDVVNLADDANGINVADKDNLAGDAN